MQIRYLYGPGIDHILESVDSVGTKQHFADALGSVTRITDSTGTRYKLMVYDSYGNMTSDTGSVQADYVSYTGREAERDLDIYYYRARYYDPLTGRFMVRDPIGFSAGDVNLYRYVGNNPASLRDPFGLTEYILVSTSHSWGWGYGSIEYGEYFLINTETMEYDAWTYLSLGAGLSIGWSVQTEVGSFTGQDAPTEISPISLTVSAFATAIHGISGQITGTSFWGGGDMGWSAGYATGGGAGISGLLTGSFWHIHGDVLPEWITELLNRGNCE